MTGTKSTGSTDVVTATFAAFCILLFLHCCRPVESAAWMMPFSSNTVGRFAHNRVKNSNTVPRDNLLQQRHYSAACLWASWSIGNGSNDDDDIGSCTEAAGISTTRRNIFIKPVLASVGSNLLQLEFPGIAMASQDDTSSLFTRQTDQFAYQFEPPPMFEQSGKPLKTHLDEVIFKSTNTGGYQIGITIDPVRINSLQQFGTADEVAAKVVLAEVNRDGVLDVTLMQDAYASSDNDDDALSSSFYQLNYQSKGTRGTKRFVTKFYVSKQKLYALTAQCREDDYATVEKELLQAVDSFRLVF